VDGDQEFEVPKKQLKENGKPYFEWAFCFVSSVKKKSKSVTKAHHCCMDCVVCPEENCTFKARLLWPSKKWMGAPRKHPKIFVLFTSVIWFGFLALETHQKLQKQETPSHALSMSQLTKENLKQSQQFTKETMTATPGPHCTNLLLQL